MKKRVADIVAETLIELGINECFSVVGGGSMHLNNAFEVNDKMHITYCHHEQSCAFAAEGFAKYNGNIAVVSVTSGPGGINALNGVYSAWVDSTPMIVIAGHPRSDTTVKACGLNLRCRGVQEYDIIPTVEGMTKFAIMITNPISIKKEIKKAYNIAMEGRRGPVWISIPLDIQATLIEDDDLAVYEKGEPSNFIDEEAAIFKIIEKLSNAKRPCILTGSGIRYGNSMSQFIEFLQIVQIPIVGGALLPDTLPEGFPLFYGLSGNIGPRAGNFILQSADLILVLGNSLSVRQTGFSVENFAPNAYFIMVDVEKDEPFKPGLHTDFPVQMELKTFFQKFNAIIGDKKISAFNYWVKHCQKIYDFFKDFDEPEYNSNGKIPAKLFWKNLRKAMPVNSAIALGNSNCVVGIYQYGIIDKHQRVITNYNAGSMGDDLPEAIGMAVAAKGPVYCITGDGSIMMNLQELETIKYNNFPIKIIVFSNNGYGAIRQTCKNYFNGQYTGCDSTSGIDFPCFKNVAAAFKFSYIHCKECGEINSKIQEFIEAEGQVLMEVDQLLDDPILPRIVSKLGEDGKFETPGFTDLYPYLDAATTKKLIFDQEDITDGI